MGFVVAVFGGRENSTTNDVRKEGKENSVVGKRRYPTCSTNACNPLYVRTSNSTQHLLRHIPIQPFARPPHREKYRNCDPSPFPLHLSSVREERVYIARAWMYLNVLRL
ncbi:hypothetical protein BDZ45DRAFT_376552 [Acephala macrosclerotiorum]|nr:hypothetical protein BDZ45DRAFT_376552 [Acephala macrosclerotiorum]